MGQDRHAATLLAAPAANVFWGQAVHAAEEPVTGEAHAGPEGGSIPADAAVEDVVKKRHPLDRSESASIAHAFLASL